MATKSKHPVPEGHTTVTAVLGCADARREIEFLKKALGAKELFTKKGGPDGSRIMWAEVQVGTATVALHDTMPACGSKSAKELGGSPVSFYLYVPDVDAAYAKAVKNGAIAKEPVADLFWGDRMGTIECPEGFLWMIATHTTDYTDAEIAEGQKKFQEALAAAGATH